MLLRILSLILLTVFPLLANAQEYKTETGHVEFDSSVPLHSFTGKSDHLVGKIMLQDSIVDFYVDVNTLKTGIKKRDNDMFRTLEAEEYPFAEFYGKLISDFNPNEKEPQNVQVQGEFSVHGVSKEVTIPGTLQSTEDGLKVEATWEIDMEEYDIEPPGILFYRVSEIIEVSISATLAPS